MGAAARGGGGGILSEVAYLMCGMHTGDSRMLTPAALTQYGMHTDTSVLRSRGCFA